MALVIFESQVNMLTVATPSIGGFIVAYDLDGKLKQKDSNGLITLVGATGYAGPLVDTLALGNNSGTYSIVMGNNTAITSAVGTASIKLDNNFIRLSTDGDSYQESYVTISPTQINLTAKGGSSSILLSDSVEIAYKNTDKIYLTNDLFYVTLNGDKVVNFTTSTASQPAGPKISGVISSEQSYFSTLVTNSLILGGTNIIGTQSNSVYVPNILTQGLIKGIDGTAQLDFTQYNEAFLTSGDYIIGLVSSSASLAPNKNGVIMVDTLNSFSTTGVVNTGITYISSVNSSNNSGIVNSVIIGGIGLSATESNTVYLGNNVNINNAYKLPINDGSINQVIITDGMGNLSWGSSVSNQVITITAASFSSLSSYMANTTYKITDADSSLYGGTEIYLLTNASGVLNDRGIGKFYNPKYNQAITGYGIWNSSASYATSSMVIWGNYLWENINGTNLNASIDQFTLNPTEWNLIPFNSFNYNISYDEIKYDVVNNRITYRNERNTNIVNTSYDKIQTASFSAIKAFQWGNLYNTSTQKGVGSVKVDGTSINLINATSSNFTSKNYFGGSVYVGTASVSGFKLENGTQANGYILTSDSDGVGTWAPLSSVGISGSASYLPKFTGTSSLSSSNFIDNGLSGFYSVGSSSVVFIPGGNVLLKLLRPQSSMDFFLGNPEVPQANIIQSINSFGFNLSSQSYLVLSSGPSYSEAMRITSTGNIGIGLTGPSTKLHVFGTQSGAFRLQDGTQASGYILTSDSNGVGTWTASTTVAVITTTSSITTNTLDDSGFNQRGRCVIINNGTYSVNITVNATSGFSSTYLKHGTASISFVQGSGRTLVQVDGTLNLNGSVGSTATIISYGTTDYLRINNA